MRSPCVAILWETWRATRAHAAFKLALGIVWGLAVLLLYANVARHDPDNHEVFKNHGAVFAMILLVLPHLGGWQSMAELSGARRGFPLFLHYTRPVRTAVSVGLPMAYLTALSCAIYLVSALLLRVVSGHAFPLLPVAAWIAAFTVVVVAATWSIRNRTLQVMLTVAAISVGLNVAMHRLTDFPHGFRWYNSPKLWPTIFDFPFTDYAWIAVIGLASFGVTVAAVTQQRRGEAQATINWNAGGGLWGWLVNLFRLPCPASSPLRAQIWLDLKLNGLPLLMIGVVLAGVIVLLSAVSGPFDAARNADPAVSCPIRECFYARALPPLLAPLSLLVLLFLGRNAFGIRSGKGRTYLSAFEATQPHGAAQLAALKLLVRSVCLLAALIALGASVLISMPLLGDAVFIQMWNVPLNSQLSTIKSAVAALSGYEQLVLVVVAVVAVVIWVAAFAVYRALCARYSHRMGIAASSLLAAAIVLAVAALVARGGMAAANLAFDAMFAAARWIFFTAMLLTTASAFRASLAERVLTIRYASGAVAISAAFGAAWLSVLHMAGVQLAGMPAINAVSILSPAFLPPILSILAPWSLSRVRHL